MEFHFEVFDTGNLIAVASLILSVWNLFARWRDKQPRIFVSDVNVEFFENRTMQEAFVRFDLTLNVLSEQPLPISRASVSMGKAKSCDCMYRSPTPSSLDRCNEHASDRNRKLNDFFGQDIRFPTTLSPSSAQHICLWLSLPADHELLRSLQEAAFSPIVEAETSTWSKCHRILPLPRNDHGLNDEQNSLQKHCISFLFQSGNRTITASSLIDIRSSLALLD